MANAIGTIAARKPRPGSGVRQAPCLRRSGQSYCPVRSNHRRSANGKLEPLLELSRNLEDRAQSPSYCRGSSRSGRDSFRRRWGGAPALGLRRPATAGVHSKQDPRANANTGSRARERRLGFSLTVSAARADYFRAARFGSRRRPRQEYADRNHQGGGSRKQDQKGWAE
jgi:hypothetical protein